MVFDTPSGTGDKEYLGIQAIEGMIKGAVEN